MKQSIALVGLLGAIFTVAAADAETKAQEAPTKGAVSIVEPSPNRTVRETYEYKVLLGTRLSGAELNDLGKEGWELVSLIYHEKSNTTTLYFKRPLILNPKPEQRQGEQAVDGNPH